MSKSNLLKEAIADAKAVRATALANAKNRMEEAFTPRLQSMISTKLQNEVEGEDDEEVVDEPETVDVEPGAEANVDVEPTEEPAPEGEEEPVDVDVEPDAEADVDVEGGDEPVEIETEPEGGDVDVEVEPSEEEPEEEEPVDESDLDLESIIRELEDESEEDEMEEPMFTDEAVDDVEDEEELDESDGMEATHSSNKNTSKGMEDKGDVTPHLTGGELNAGGGEQVSPDRGKPFNTEIGAELPADSDLTKNPKHYIYEEDEDDENFEDEGDVEINIDEILHELEENDYNGFSYDPMLSKTSKQSDPFEFQNQQLKERVGSLTKDLKEHRQVIKFLKSKLNEVNLLNAKLLFTSKLFKSKNMNNSEKMKIIESFDRAKTLREVKLVYSTIAESINATSRATKIVKKITENFGGASKVVASTKPSKKKVITESIVSEEGANRLQKLAGIKKK